MSILWLKAFHVFFMVAWFAGLFYLPRLFVYHAECLANTASSDDLTAKQRATSEVFKTMERRLLYFVTPFALFTLAFGIALIHAYGRAWFVASGWLHTKLLLVVLLFVYHGYCFVLLAEFKNLRRIKSPRFYRIFNEIPVLILLAIIILATVKPY